MRVLAVSLLLVTAVACGSPKPDPDEPTTAAEKQRRDAIKSGEIDSDGGKWGGWKYKGDRADCFFVVGRNCYKTEKAACNAAKCKTAAACVVEGGGPALVSCATAKK